jgi:hypothetical protein
LYLKKFNRGFRMRAELTDAFCRSAKPKKGKFQTDYFDEKTKGLCLRVTNRSKSWGLMFTNAAGKRQRKTLGFYPAMTLTQARTVALMGAQLGVEVADSQDPTIATAFTTFLDSKARKTRDEVQRRFDKNALPLIGAVPVSQFHRVHANLVIDSVKRRGTLVEALRVGEDLRAFGRFCLAHGWRDSDPLAAIKLPAKPAPRERYLSEEEIKTLWHGVETLRPDYAAIVRLCLVTGQRRSEVALMEKAELDLAARTWVIPASRSKNGKSHLVPLNDLACEIIEAALVKAGDSGLLFPTSGMLNTSPARSTASNAASRPGGGCTTCAGPRSLICKKRALRRSS